MQQKRIIIFAAALLIFESSVAFDNQTIQSTEKLPKLEDDYPMEVQSAQCTITTGDVQASAQAKISKRLEGVCGSKEMALAFQTLEFRLMQELQVIRTILNNYIAPGAFNNIPNTYATYSQPYQPQQQQQQQPPQQQFQPEVAPQQTYQTNYNPGLLSDIYNSNYNNPYQNNQVYDNGHQSSIAPYHPYNSNYQSSSPEYSTTQLGTQTPMQTQYEFPQPTKSSGIQQSYANDWHQSQYPTTTDTNIAYSTPTWKHLKPLQPIYPMDNTIKETSDKLSTTMSTLSITSEASTEADRTSTSTTTEQPIATTPTERVLDFRPVQVKSLEKTKADIERQRRLKLQKMMFTSRDFEVHKFNNTILAGGEIRIFSYYWKIENFTKSLGNNMAQISSPVFSISGLHLRINAQLNHLNRDYLYLQVESVATEMIERDSNIVLETGHLFKEIETKKYFRHKISILDQASPSSDIISQEFMNTNSGFSVPNSAIIGSPYTKNDGVLVKIQIFL